jgi:hypothetical protein
MVIHSPMPGVGRTWFSTPRPRERACLMSCACRWRRKRAATQIGRIPIGALMHNLDHPLQSESQDTQGIEPS